MIKSIIAVIRQRRWKAKKKVVATDVCTKAPQGFKTPKGLVACRVDCVNIIKSAQKLNLQVDKYENNTYLCRENLFISIRQ